MDPVNKPSPCCSFSSSPSSRIGEKIWRSLLLAPRQSAESNFWLNAVESISRLLQWGVSMLWGYKYSPVKLRNLSSGLRKKGERSRGQHSSEPQKQIQELGRKYTSCLIESSKKYKLVLKAISVRSVFSEHITIPNSLMRWGQTKSF